MLNGIGPCFSTHRPKVYLILLYGLTTSVWSVHSDTSLCEFWSPPGWKTVGFHNFKQGYFISQLSLMSQDAVWKMWSHWSCCLNHLDHSCQMACGNMCRIVLEPISFVLLYHQEKQCLLVFCCWWPMEIVNAHTAKLLGVLFELVLNTFF